MSLAHRVTDSSPRRSPTTLLANALAVTAREGDQIRQRNLLDRTATSQQRLPTHRMATLIARFRRSWPSTVQQPAVASDGRFWMRGTCCAGGPNLTDLARCRMSCKTLRVRGFSARVSCSMGRHPRGPDSTLMVTVPQRSKTAPAHHDQPPLRAFEDIVRRTAIDPVPCIDLGWNDVADAASWSRRRSPGVGTTKGIAAWESGQKTST